TTRAVLSGTAANISISSATVIAPSPRVIPAPYSPTGSQDNGHLNGTLKPRTGSGKPGNRPQTAILGGIDGQIGGLIAQRGPHLRATTPIRACPTRRRPMALFGAIFNCTNKQFSL